MRTIWTLALKDLKLLSRDWFGLFWMLVFPLLIGLFFGFLQGGGGSDKASMKVAVVDEDQSDGSRALIKRLADKKMPDSDRPLLVLNTELTREQAYQQVLKGRLVAFIVIPRGRGDVLPFGPAAAPLEIGYDPRRNAEVGFLQGTLMETSFLGFQDQFGDPKKAKEQVDRVTKDLDNARDMPAGQKLVVKTFFKALETFMGDLKPGEAQPDGLSLANQVKLEAVASDGKSPATAFEVTFPSSILWGILGCVTTFAVSLVLERVQGTFLRLQVAPASWGQLLAGKGLACFMACCGVAVILLLIGSVVFKVRLGNLSLLALAVVSTAICFTGIMMFVSTLGKTPAGVAGAGWGVMMPMTMIGGGMIPLIAMPEWLRIASSFSPVSWAIYSIEGAVWRGLTFWDVLPSYGVLLGVGAAGFFAGAQILSLRETGRRWLF